MLQREVGKVLSLFACTLCYFLDFKHSDVMLDAASLCPPLTSPASHLGSCLSLWCLHPYACWMPMLLHGRGTVFLVANLFFQAF